MRPVHCPACQHEMGVPIPACCPHVDVRRMVAEVMHAPDELSAIELVTYVEALQKTVKRLRAKKPNSRK